MLHLEPFFSSTDAFLGLGRCSKVFWMPFTMLSWCFVVLFSDGCVPETPLKPEVFLLFRSQNLSGFSCTEQKFEC